MNRPSACRPDDGWAFVHPRGVESTYERTNERREYNGRDYDFSLNAVMRETVPTVWDAVGGRPGPDAEGGLRRLRSQLRFMHFAWNQFYLGLLRDYSAELDALLAEIDAYLEAGARNDRRLPDERNPVSEDYSRWRPHPWHGLPAGPAPPSELHVFVEITPFDLVKYEVDKASGYLRVDRSQRTSSLPPALYGFIPQTYAGDRVAALMPGVDGGDRDPLDICVLSERPIARAEVIVTARVVGGIPMVDGGQADDKIVGILHDDPVFGGVREIEDVPPALIGRLTHYFSTYKLRPESGGSVIVGEPYGRTHAEAVVAAALDDYRERFGGQA
ncbi:MAG TPA: inorganic pyrophosphatase [Longimicrobiales bacterium]|nr:inorganic pyrophosphatase [Longimicrobiales bacterium]